MTLHRPTDFARTSLSVTEASPPIAETSRPRPATRHGGRGHARPLEARDLERVADIFLRVFRGIEDPAARRAALPALVAYLADLYLGAPWHEAELGSLVYLDADDDPVGFLGSVEMHLRFGDTRLRASAMGTYMVADQSHDSRAALTLIRQHLGCGIDLHFTDTANRISLEFNRPLRFELMPMHSLEWVCPLKPASLVLSRVARRWPRLPTGLAAPLARRLDGPLRGLVQGRDGGRPHRPIDVHDLDRAGFLALAPAHVARRKLRPDWSAEELGWLIDQAALRVGNGPLRMRVGRDAQGRDVGFWLIYAAPGGIAAVLQVFAQPGHERATLEAVIADAEALGCVAVRGSSEPALMEALYAVPGLIFHHKGATCLRSRHPEVMEAIRAGDVAVGGLTGEGWTRLISDRF